jgi:uncharacterized protein YjbI with pentapeptide repeats
MARLPGKVAAKPVTAPPRVKTVKPPKIDPKLQALKDQAEDLGVARKALDDAVSMTRGLWISFISLSAYLMVAVGAVTHVDLFLENPLELPLVGVKVPLVVFFWLAPILYLIVHTYLLLNLKLMSDNVRSWLSRLEATLAMEAQDSERSRLADAHKLGLPNFFPVQILAAPTLNQRGFVRWVMATAVKVTVVFGPILLLFLFQAQFLPYHKWQVTALHRVIIFADMLAVWFFWREIIGRGKSTGAFFNSFTVLGTVFVFALSIFVATFPGETLHLRYLGLREILFEGKINEVTGRPASLFSNRLVLLDQDFVELGDEQIEKIDVTRSFRGRNLEEAVFARNDLRKVDFAGAKLTEANFIDSRLEGAEFGCAFDGSEDGIAQISGKGNGCTSLQGANFSGANAQGASFLGAQLQGAVFDNAKLYGANFGFALLQGANFDHASLQGADFDSAQLQGASFYKAQLQGASFFFSSIQGAFFESASLQGATLDNAFVWRVRGIGAANSEFVQAHDIVRAQVYRDLFTGDNLSFSAGAFLELQKLTTGSVSSEKLKREIQASISVLDPSAKDDSLTSSQAELDKLETNESDSARAIFLGELACSVEGAPYLAAGMLLRKRDKSEGTIAALEGKVRAQVANHIISLKASKSCPGIRGEAEDATKQLREWTIWKPYPEVEALERLDAEGDEIE